jgi:DinB superfamily
MTYTLTDGREILAGTPGALRATLGGLSETWLEADEGPGTWSPWQALAHLRHIEERDWLGRIDTILVHGAEEDLGPVDREGGFERFARWGVGRVLDRFEGLRAENLRAFDELHLGPEDLMRVGRHPELGEVTLGQLLATWAVHDLNHESQIVKTLAKRYREAVGPVAAEPRGGRPPLDATRRPRPGRARAGCPTGSRGSTARGRSCRSTAGGSPRPARTGRPA